MPKIPERKNIPEKYKWDLSALCTGDGQWDERFNAVSQRVTEAASYRDRLHEDTALLEFLKLQDGLSAEYGQLYLYAHMKSDTDLTDAKNKERTDRIDTAMVNLSATLSFATPEICKRSAKQLTALSECAEFSDYSYLLSVLAKNKKYVLSAKEEKLLSESGSFSDGFHEAFNMFDNADIRFDKITLNGKEAELSHGVYALALQSKDREERRQAFESMFNAYKQNINTVTALYANHLKKDWFYAKVRGYDSCLQKAMFASDVKREAYDNLIKCVNGNTGLMHQYMAFRKKALGGDLNMYDLHTSIVEGASLSLSYEKACAVVKEALAPLGEEYASLFYKAFNDKWIDVMESKGKRSGAYSWGTYGAHPNVLLNYQKTTHDIFTIAHELGHSMHSYYSNKVQPFAKSDYVIFVAEIASTVNEVLLLKHLLKSADLKTRKYLLSYYLDMFRTTLFRQTMFAQFELEAHTLAENDMPVSRDALCGIYLDLNKKYYGKAVKHNDLIKYEWARIPHFYRSYYVYQYATGITAAVSIANGLLSGRPGALEGYMQFLSAGGSIPPLDILALAGVDLTDEQPFDVAMKEFSDTLKELKRIF